MQLQMAVSLLKADCREKKGKKENSDQQNVFSGNLFSLNTVTQHLCFCIKYNKLSFMLLQ